eukprot:TRINITY_DN10881_c0_g1_i3.p1 TRINITY_DN10881_c0_g1~~TRINITY_DN10881_c0_g1_i3.p1  ORF type:complete len:209 (+),score=57.33 TRINITY_DN10881_c0_g1_i3:195-821(+)
MCIRDRRRVREKLERSMADQRQMEAMRLFCKIDSDKDGVLSMEELAIELTDYGMPDDEIERLFLTLDLDGDGYVSEDEWIQGWDGFVHQIEKQQSQKMQREVLVALGHVRTNPAGCIARLSDRATRFTGKHYSWGSSNKVSKEGAVAVQDAVDFLHRQEPIPDLGEHVVRGLVLAGEDHAHDIGQAGVASHVGSDGSGSWDRSGAFPV